MLSPSETGTTLGATSGTCQEPGDRLLARVLGTGGARGASKARQLAVLSAARPGKAPHLIHGGPCLILPRHERLLPGPARRQPPEYQPR
jgi:hypothetical protein